MTTRASLSGGGYARTLLILGRTSNLPSIGSNCLAAWLLAGGGPWERFLILVIGASLLYLGGMFLNDAFDEPFDRTYRPERPIPSGKISPTSVWAYGGAGLILGLAVLVPLGWQPFLLGVVLAGLIVVYDAAHKSISWSPLLIAGCRFVLYLVAASVATANIMEAGTAAVCAVGLAAYVVGLSYLARRESAPGALKHWPLACLALPLAAAWGFAHDDTWVPPLIFSVLLLGWIARSLRFTFALSPPDIGRSVGGLLAGIVLVDGLYAVGHAPMLAPVFIALFVLALIFQHYVPAT